MIYKLPKPLYHGTSRAAIPLIATGRFLPPLSLTEDKRMAIHYAKARAAQIEEQYPNALKGYVVYTFKSVPNKAFLKKDTYSPRELGQWVYNRKMSVYQHISRAEEFPLNVSREERMRLRAYAVGMGWR